METSIATCPIARIVNAAPVAEEPIPTSGGKVADFVAQVLPGQTVEHLARTSTIKCHEKRRWDDDSIPPTSLFFQAVHRAYASHHALGLRPEVLMYLINNVIAETVKRNPESYRHLFTDSSEKQTIKVRHDGLVRGYPSSPWNEAIVLFEAELDKRVPSQIMGDMLPTLSTATPESRIASLVAFMDSASPFYDYRVCSMCGIPRIVLFGEAADYRKLVDVSRKLSVAFKEHLDEYFKNLIPVLEEIAETAEGKSNDQNFWNELYKHEDGSGGPTFAGWISAFLWYVNSVDHKTNTKTLVVKYKGHYDWNKIQYGGISSGSEPSHLSSVPFVWNYFGTEIPMTFVAGILAVEEAEGALTPVLSYGVLNQAKTK